MNKKDLLVWMDLEMTGLNPGSDTIIEIATLITDSSLDIVAMGPEYVIFQDDKVLEGMNEWCKVQHAKSGLVDRVRQSKISMADAERETLDFLKQYVDKEENPLCGNSIHQDRNFLSVFMPELNDHLHYRNIDISSIKELAFRWFPDLPKFEKKSQHTALEDIKESISELKYYREQIFVKTLE